MKPFYIILATLSCFIFYSCEDALLEDNDLDEKLAPIEGQVAAIINGKEWVTFRGQASLNIDFLSFISYSMDERLNFAVSYNGDNFYDLTDESSEVWFSSGYYGYSSVNGYLQILELDTIRDIISGEIEAQLRNSNGVTPDSILNVSVIFNEVGLSGR